MDEIYILQAVGIIALITMAIRFLPFIIFNGKNKTPVFVERLGKILPFAVMGMLVVYCLKDMNFKTIDGFVPLVISCLVVTLSYIWKLNTLVSIVVGTLCYMVLIQFVF